MKSTGDVFVRLLQFTGLALLSAVTVSADQTWVGTSNQTNDWNVSANWSGGTVPSNTIARIVNGGTAEIGADAPPIRGVYVAAMGTGSQSGTVAQTAGRLAVSGSQYPVLIGYSSGSGKGTYDVSGGTLTVSGGVFIGSSEAHDQSFGTGLLAVRGTGVVEHTGSLFYVAHYGRTGSVVVADSGRLTLNTGTMVLGEGGPANIGTLDVSGGTFSARGLDLAQTGGNAYVGMSGGSVWLDGLTSGNGVADIRLSGGTLGRRTGMPCGRRQ